MTGNRAQRRSGSVPGPTSARARGRKSGTIIVEGSSASGRHLCRALSAARAHTFGQRLHLSIPQRLALLVPLPHGLGVALGR